MRRTIALRALLLTTLTIAAAGCTPWATYPNVEGAAGINDPSVRPIPDLMAKGVAYTAEKDGVAPDEVVFNLPPGTPLTVWERVNKRLGPAKPMGEVGEPAYHVVAVRIRTYDAEVDVIHPTKNGDQLVTLSFKEDLFSNGFQVKSERVWRYVLTDVEVPLPSYPTEVDVQYTDATTEGGEGG